MDKYKLIWTQLQFRIFKLLCLKAGEKLSQREIAKYLEVSPTAVGNSLELLEKENLIKIEKNRSMNLISLNRDEKKAINLKRVENLRLMYESELINHLENQLPGGTILLFGSYSRGEDTNTSDIDIAVIGRKDKLLNLENFETILNRKININFYDSWKKIHNNLKNNILNGIVFIGGVEL